MNAESLKKIPLTDAAGAGVCGLLTILFVAAIFWPNLSAQQELAQKRQALATAQTKAAQINLQIRSATNELAGIQRSIAAGTFVLQPADQLNKRLADITRFCQEHGLEIQELTPGSVAPGSRYDSVGIHLAGRGDFHAWMSMLHLLHEQHQDVAVSGFSLSGNPQAGTPTLSAEMQLNWFSRPSGVVASGR